MLAAVFIWATFSNNKSSGDAGEPPETEQLRNVRWTRDFVLSFILGGAAVLIIYALQFLMTKGNPLQELLAVLGAGGLLAMASMMFGALLGFIFGIPRYLRERQTGAAQSASASQTPSQSPDPKASAPSKAAPDADARSGTSQFQSNTNLEEISDWLTKIIVGLGLTKLAKMPDYVTRLTWFVSHAIGQDHQAFNENVAFSLMTAFSICGFFMGYLMTRLFLPQAFNSTLQDTVKEKLQADVHLVGQEEQSLDAVPDAAAMGSAIKRALAIQNTSQGVNESVIRDQISKLAQDYAALRLSMPSGGERTSALEQVAAQMKSLGFAAQPLLDKLKKSDAEGEHLAAVTALEVKPDEDSLDWLVDRIDLDRPFVGYHAALALLAAARAFTQPSPNSASQTVNSLQARQQSRVCAALDRGMKVLEGKQLQETDRYRVLQAALTESGCTRPNRP